MLRRSYALHAAALCAALAPASAALAGVPSAIAYIAEVTVAGSQTPFNGTVQVEIALYPSANSPVPVWGPQDLGPITVDNGVLSFLIGGPGTPPLDDALAQWEVWLELSLDGVNLSPRQQALAVPYARLAADSERLGGLEASAFAQASTLATVATSGSYLDLDDAFELALIGDLADIAFTGDVANLSGNPATSILGPAFLERAGDSMLGDLDMDFNRLLHVRIQAAAAPLVPCGPAALGTMYFDTTLDELRVCGVSGWVSGGGAGGGVGPTPSVFAATMSPSTVDQLAVPGACEPVGFTNFSTEPVSGFGAPQVAGSYTASGCPPTTCAGTLAAGASCEVFIRGAAVVSGPLSGSVSVVASQGGTAVAVVLGTASLSSGAELAALISPVVVNQASLPGACAEVGFTNVGGEAATGFSAPVVTGAYTALGCSASTCTGTLASGGTCAVFVRGNATASGPITGSVSVSATSGGTAVAALTGQATLSLGVRMAVAHLTAPFASVYAADSAPFVKLGNVTPLPGNAANGAAFSPDGQRLAVGHSASPFVSVYNLQSEPYTRLSNPNVLPASSGLGVAFSADGSRLAVAHGTTPFVSVYDTSTTPYTKLANPGVLPASTGRGVAFRPDGLHLAVAHSVAPCITVYQTSVVPYARLDDPAVLPSSTCYTVAYSPDGQRLAVGHNGTPRLTVYDTTTSPYTKINEPPPASLPNVAVFGVAYSPDGKFLALAQSSAPTLIVYDTTTTPWTRLEPTTVMPTGQARGIAFSPDGAWLGVAHSEAPFTSVYDTSTVPFTKVINPNVPPTGVGNGVAFGFSP